MFGSKDSVRVLVLRDCVRLVGERPEALTAGAYALWPSNDVARSEASGLVRRADDLGHTAAAQAMAGK